MNRLATATILLVLGLCGSVHAADPSDAAKLLALVNSRPITVGGIAGKLRLRRIDPARAPRRIWLAELDAAIDHALLLAAAKAERGNQRDANGPTPDTLAQAYVNRTFGAKLFVSENEIEEWYKHHKQTLRTGGVRIARVITVGARRQKRDLVSDERALARAEIDAVRKKAVAGEDFAELARGHSMDPYAASGGLLPPVRKTGKPNFAAEVFKIRKRGDISEVFETPFGLHIVKLEAIRAPAVPPLREARPRIRQTLRQLKWNEHVGPHLARLRSQADIRIIKSALPGSGAGKAATPR